MTNVLAPGNAGPVSAPQSDDRANPPVSAPPQQAGAAQPPQIGSAQDAAAAQFAQLKDAQAKIKATMTGIEKLMTLGDTVTSKDVVKEASGMVAAGIPAVEVAGILADMPETSEAIQSWLTEQEKSIQQRDAQVEQAMKSARYQLGLAATRSILAHSAEDHFARKAAAAQPPAATNQLSVGGPQ